MKKILPAALFIFLTAASLHAQNPSGCGDPKINGKMLTHDDASARARSQSLVQQQTVISIPVVFHVLHSLNGYDPYPTGSNVPHQDLVDMIQYTNTLLRKQNPDTAQIPAPFLPLAADCNIELCLAQTDPQGNAMYETGVVRINAAGMNPSVLSDPSAFGMVYAPQYAWDPTRYFNIWIMPSTFYNQFSGYGIFPDSSGLGGLSTGPNPYPMGDGIFLSYWEVDPNSKLLIHEVGHFLGLRHIWGDANCGDDYCNDTPTQSYYTSGCPAFPTISCGNGPNGDMFTNFMDYTSYICQHQLTHGQKSRMLTVLANSPRRRELVNSTVCNAAPVQPPVAAFSRNPVSTCSAMPITFYDSSGYQPTSWNWSFPGGNPSTSSLQNPTIQYSSAGTYSATLIVTNAAGADTFTFVNCVTILPHGSYTYPSYENFESISLPPPDWDLIVNPFNQPPPNWQLGNASAYGNGSKAMWNQFWAYHPIRSNELDFSNAQYPVLSFDYASAADPNQQPDYPDSMLVQVSVDCGSTYTTVFNMGNAQYNTAAPMNSFVPQPNDWRTVHVHLAQYVGVSSLYVQILGWAVPNYTWFDNINLVDWGPQGIEPDHAESMFAVYPNPSSGDAVLKAAADAQLELYDVSGKRTGSASIRNNSSESLSSIFGNTLSPGIYLLRIITDADRPVTKRIVITSAE